MDSEIIFPFKDKSNLRGLVLSILSNEFPLKIFEIVNFIKKRYGRKVSFQAVSKEVNFLVNQKVLTRYGRDFSINKDWIDEVKKNVNEIYEKVVLKKKTDKKSAGEDIEVLHFNSLKEAMDYWYKIIDDWFRNFKKGNSNLNCYQSLHVWESLLNLNYEEKYIGQLKSKGIKSYLLTGSTNLDKGAVKYYNKIGAKAKSIKSMSLFERSYSIGTYGEMIVQIKYSEKILKKIDKFFKENKSIETFNLSNLLKIVNEKEEVTLTVIRNAEMAKQINKSILIYFK